MLRVIGFMNGTSYDEEKNVVSVGPGGHCQDVYDTLIPYGLAVAGYADIS
jgi:FAD/FMN-containing dehydrogenase